MNHIGLIESPISFNNNLNLAYSDKKNKVNFGFLLIKYNFREGYKKSDFHLIPVNL